MIYLTFLLIIPSYSNRRLKGGKPFCFSIPKTVCAQTVEGEYTAVAVGVIPKTARFRSEPSSHS
jgi:hypothetical protein